MKKRVKKADGGMLYTGGSRDFDETMGASKGAPAPTPAGAIPSAPAGLSRALPEQANPRAAAARAAALSRFQGRNAPVATPGAGGAAPVRAMKKGGSVEGSAKDTREDKAMAKKRGMSMAKWEASAADVKHDKPMAKRGGGIAKKGKGIALRGGGIATRGMGVALKKGGMAKKRGK